MIHSQELCLHLQFIPKTKVNFKSGNSEIIVLNQATVFQSVPKNNEKTKKENGILFSIDFDCEIIQITFEHTKINFIQMNNFYLTLQTNIYVLVMIQEIAQIKKIDPLVSERF